MTKNHTTFWRTNLCILAATVAALGVLPACGGPQWEGDAEAPGTAGLALTFDILDDTDVAGFTYTLTPVDCATGMPFDPSTPIVATEDLEDMLLPGSNGTFEDAPFDPASGHLFADHFFWLDEGCYDVLVQPIDADGNPSADCASAHQDNVQVIDGQTTEILLISQCVGDGAGGLDVISALNHPPGIDGLTYDPSKFICEDTTEVCIEVSDPDNDPLTGAFVVDDTVATIVSTSTNVQDDGSVVYCAVIEVHQPGTAHVEFTVFDMGTDADGNQVTIEDLLLAQGDPNLSRDSIVFPVHLLSEDDCIDTCSCPEGYEPTPDGEECIRVDTAPAEVHGELLQVCKGEFNPNYGKYGGQFPGGTVQTSPFFGESYNDPDSRLNEVGVWACDPDSLDTGETYPTTTPTQEWIGFSVCLDIEAGADYLVGIAADNQMRFRLNGDLLFNFNTNSVDNFSYWWMNPVPLNSGTNLLALEGWNQSQAASFGAEIYGPFPAGSLTDDAAMMSVDYENNVVWSTLDMVGEPFTNGESAGYQCPDGYEVNTCEREPSCIRIDRVDCE